MHLIILLGIMEDIPTGLTTDLTRIRQVAITEAPVTPGTIAEVGSCYAPYPEKSMRTLSLFRRGYILLSSENSSFSQGVLPRP